ncbi:hypothetical protein ASPZODRAFT_373059 [Penicilliopsis zonata CBS 506.65]|uniref:Uncharacterized protein n=1 Tax=Penicilliopsis zonata CBS 506.65 TaxID=1073090 RepID=A0A1L9SW06_9EURO|nr:hypothetical protein ASPZODRAFT_373059 [Penicilliopsis zonata CBS 506.65]OJJ51369.1 hypothetical protein ASPZODRAFT_373059 [Penicilliopsis zonata CBS 506.65]
MLIFFNLAADTSSAPLSLPSPRHGHSVCLFSRQSVFHQHLPSPSSGALNPASPFSFVCVYDGKIRLFLTWTSCSVLTNLLFSMGGLTQENTRFIYFPPYTVLVLFLFLPLACLIGVDVFFFFFSSFLSCYEEPASNQDLLMKCIEVFPFENLVAEHAVAIFRTEARLRFLHAIA